MIGSMLYALLGRGVRSTLPSDVSHPGALARMSMPANGAHYATVRGEGTGQGLERFYCVFYVRPVSCGAPLVEACVCLKRAATRKYHTAVTI